MRRTIVIILLLIAPVVALGLKAAGQGSTRPVTAKPAADKWEYLAVAGPSTTNFAATDNSSMRKEESSFGREAFVLEQHLDGMGAKGWELVSVAGPPTDPVYYFKRRK